MKRFAVAACAVLAACSGAATPEPEGRFRSADLEALATEVRAVGANCMVVEHAGVVEGRWLWGEFAEGAVQEGFSTTKSVAATLVGIASDRGLLRLDQPVADIVPEWRETPSETVTVRDLLANVSGRFHDPVADYAQLAFFATDKTAFALGLGQDAEPGERWVYNNAAVQTLEAVLEAAVGGSVADFAREALFEPLGAASYLSTDAVGNAGLFAGMQTNCDDLARFVRMYLDGGTVGGTRVVSEEFVDAALRPSSELNAAYGFLWWLNRSGVVMPAAGAIATTDGPLLRALPEDAFWASGACGQIALGVPSADVVITVMRGVDLSSPAGLAACGGDSVDRIVADGLARLLAG